MQNSYHQKVNALLDKFNKLLTDNDLSNLLYRYKTSC